MKRLVLFALTFGSIAAVIAFASYRTTRWGGSAGYGQFEYQLTLVDASGNAVEGVELKVEDTRGNEYYYFPVTDFLPGKAPRSDERGAMQFHHVSTMVEWDNHGWELFWLYPIAIRSSPEFICRFLHRGEEIFRIPYGKLERRDWDGRRWDDAPKVIRRWDWPAMTPVEMMQGPNEPEEEYKSRLELFFHVDGQNKQHREGFIARDNACQRFDKFPSLLAETLKWSNILSFG